MLLRNVHAEPTVARIHIVLGLSDRLLGLRCRGEGGDLQHQVQPRHRERELGVKIECCCRALTVFASTPGELEMHQDGTMRSG